MHMATLVKKLNLGKHSINQEKSIKLRGGKVFIKSIIDNMKPEYTVADSDLLVSHILRKKQYILLHTPRDECDYEL